MILRLHFTAVAVAALEGVDHRRDGERQQEEPDDDGDLRRLLHRLHKIAPPEMDHVEVAVDGQRDEEGDAGSSVEEEHEEQRLAHQVLLAAPLALLVVVGLGGKTDHQQEVSHHDVEQEDASVLPELEPEEEVDDKGLFVCIENKLKGENVLLMNI